MPKTLKPKIRKLEVHVLRGIAVLLMITYHIVFDLNFFSQIDSVDPFSLEWLVVARSSAILFIALAGVTTAALSLHHSDEIRREKNMKRIIKLIVSAGLVTIATYLISPQNTIVIGILHFLILAILFSQIHSKKWIINAVLAVVSLVLPFAFSKLGFQSVILGNPPTSFSTFDYFPLFPWLGVFLAGIAFEQYRSKIGKFYIKFNEKNEAVFVLKFIGKHSLFIYLLHQPILLGLLHLLLS